MSAISPDLRPLEPGGFRGYLPVLPSVTKAPSSGSVERLTLGSCDFLIASARGYCYGVDRALRLADETLERFPDRRVFLTSPILHNPHIHDHLVRRGVRFLDREPDCWADLGPDDIVMIPAFGVAAQVRERAAATGALLVDTTCGSVVFVWKHVDKLAARGYTIVYHGRRGHEEAVATLSRLGQGRRATGQPDGASEPPATPHIIVENLGKAEFLASYLRGEISRSSLESALSGGFSPGFRFDQDFDRLGFANQTTMLASESAAIADLLECVQAERYPDAPAETHFRAQDTICSATDERQEGLQAVLETKPRLVVIVGGFDSSNTAHLTEIAGAAGNPAYHVEDARDVLSGSRIRHRDPRTSRIVESSDWLPRGPIRIGASCGASTPEASLQSILRRIASLHES